MYTPNNLILMNFSLPLFFTLLYLISGSSLNGQENKIKMFNENQTGYDKNGAVKESAGIIEDKYLSVESDYGRGLDFKNNINTFISVYSLNTGKQINRFSLNVIAAGNTKEVDDIFFSKVFVWKNKIIGFYSLKYKKEDIFPVKAIICDINGKLIKKVDYIGDRYYGGVQIMSSFLTNGEYQTDLASQGRSILLSTEGFSFSMNTDSSYLALVSGFPDVSKGKLKIRVFNPDLELVKEINPKINNMDESASLRKFAIDNTGNIFICTSRKESGKKEKKNDYNTITEIHIAELNTEKTTSFKIDLQGLFPAEINIKFTKKNTPILMGSFTRNITNKTAYQKHGIFSATIDTKSMTVINFNKADFSAELLSNFLAEKQIKNGQGLHGGFNVKYTFENQDNGIYFIMQNDYKVVTKHGTTGAMNIYQDMTNGYIVSSIGESGKIDWVKSDPMTSWNFENKTRGGRPGFIPSTNFIFLLTSVELDEKKGNIGLVAKKINKDPTSPHQVLFTFVKGDERFDIIEGNLIPIGNGEYAGLIYNTPKKMNGSAPVRLFKVKL